MINCSRLVPGFIFQPIAMNNQAITKLFGVNVDLRLWQSMDGFSKRRLTSLAIKELTL
jgi:hypothetical protein